MPRRAELPTPGDFARVARRKAKPGRAMRGEVWLVGAGPGDPELLTLRALKLMQFADIALYDNLVSPAVLDLLPPSTERVYVGKRNALPGLRQQEINALLVRHARAGKRVLRLKGGDPFIFGRGGEEIDTLSAHRIAFEVVPGITAALGVAAYAGIPLTHRDYAQSCVFVTGHVKENRIDLDWRALARPRQTVVVYMGLVGLPILTQKLIEHGLKPTTPAAVVEQGTSDEQRVVAATLATLAARALAAKLHGPTLTIIGEVVRLRRKLNWFVPEGADSASALPRARPAAKGRAAQEPRSKTARPRARRRTS